MLNAFEEAAAAHSAAVDDIYGEPLQWLPQRDGGEMSAGGPDPTRPSREIRGAISRRAITVRQAGQGANSRDNVEAAEMRTHVSFGAALAGPDGVRKGDIVVRIGRPGAPRLKLLAPLPIEGRRIHPALPTT